MLAGNILMKKELAGSTMGQKCLRGSQKAVKSAKIPNKTVVATKRKGILMITRGRINTSDGTIAARGPRV